MKTHSLGSSVIMFITAIVLIVEIIFVTFVRTNSPIIFLLLFLITLYFFWRSTFRYGHYRPDKLEPFIKENRIYTFRGYDPTTNILFLVEHIHLEIPKQEQITAETSGLYSTQQLQTELEPVDFEEAALYRGRIFTENLAVGETVIAVVKDGGAEEKNIGVERYKAV